jgi:hypothetical protein
VVSWESSEGFTRGYSARITDETKKAGFWIETGWKARSQLLAGRGSSWLGRFLLGFATATNGAKTENEQSEHNKLLHEHTSFVVEKHETQF